MTLVRMSTRGRVTIPKKLRDELGLKPGDIVVFYETTEGLIMEPVRGTLLERMGSVSVEGRQDFEKVREEVKRNRGKLRGK